MWDCQRTVRVSLLGSDDSQGPGAPQGVHKGVLLASLPVILATEPSGARLPYSTCRWPEDLMGSLSGLSTCRREGR
eukprot:590753-Prorocentrum_minimum.AAC.1